MFARHLEKKSQNANSQTEKDDRTCSFAKIPHGILEFVATTAPRRRPVQTSTELSIQSSHFASRWYGETA